MSNRTLACTGPIILHIYTDLHVQIAKSRLPNQTGIFNLRLGYNYTAHLHRLAWVVIIAEKTLRNHKSYLYRYITGFKVHA